MARTSTTPAAWYRDGTVTVPTSWSVAEAPSAPGKRAPTAVGSGRVVGAGGARAVGARAAAAVVGTAHQHDDRGRGLHDRHVQFELVVADLGVQAGRVERQSRGHLSSISFHRWSVVRPGPSRTRAVDQSATGQEIVMRPWSFATTP